MQSHTQERGHMGGILLFIPITVETFLITEIVQISWAKCYVLVAGEIPQLQAQQVISFGGSQARPVTRKLGQVLMVSFVTWMVG
jgi:hypothetical protein